MEKGRGKGDDTLQTDNVFTRKEYIEREAVREMIVGFPCTMSVCLTVKEKYYQITGTEPPKEE